METQVRTPQMVFMQPQRLVVPLFQRPYVWNEENQWKPLWEDVVRVANRLLDEPQTRPYPHFLGAVVLQQVQNQVGAMQERIIIDGQQRLTTLQLLFDALHAELVAVNATAASCRLESLVINQTPFCRQPEDRFKVWPTNRDRAAFNAVMAAVPPIDYGALEHPTQKLVEAHRFFGERAREWLLASGSEQVQPRAAAIETVVRDLLQMVVIDLGADENAQEIFETLNARGTQLTAADLIKNFIFQRLLESDADVESAYETYWREFESAFWEVDVSVGRLHYARSSIFLNHWLIARTGEEIVAREVFTRFKRFAFDVGIAMPQLLAEVDRAASVYRSFIERGDNLFGSIDRFGLFAYRTNVLESEVVKPLVLHLCDPELPPVPDDQFNRALGAVESWMVRRMLMRATTQNYNQVIAELIAKLRDENRSVAAVVVEKFLAGQTSGSRYLPDDNEICEELRNLRAYKRLRRGRLRMVLEAIEDHLRGWRGDTPGLGGERVTRGKFAIEHIMPRKWDKHWGALNDSQAEAERVSLIDNIGNLTLLTTKLNSKVSNGPWLGAGGKRKALEAHDVLFLNRELLKTADVTWTEQAIRSRCDIMANAIIEIWPAPAGHRSGFTNTKVRRRHSVDLADLISAGYLEAGMPLFPRQKKFADQIATLLPDGRLDVGGKIFGTPSEASNTITGKITNGWKSFVVAQNSKRTLRDVRLSYLESLAAEGDMDDADDEADDDS